MRILVGIINDGHGWYIGPDGKIHHFPGGPGDPEWNRISRTANDQILGRAVNELGTLITDMEIQKQIQQIGNALLKGTGKAVGFEGIK